MYIIVRHGGLLYRMHIATGDRWFMSESGHEWRPVSVVTVFKSGLEVSQ